MAGEPRTALVEASAGQILKACGDADAALAAYERALAMDPDFLPARLDAGHLLADQGKSLEANRHYRAALDQASKIPQLPMALQTPLGRARDSLQVEQAALEEKLQEALRGVRAALPADGNERFDECYDILMGRKRAQLPKPAFMHFPKLPPLSFYGRELFPWAAALEARTPQILAEVQAMMAGSESAFIPYVQKDDADVPDSQAWRDLNKNDDWGVFFLHNQGERVARHCAALPLTAAALDEVPMVRIPGRGPTAFLSRLRPGTHIPPHHGATNTRLICHLPLVIPGNCAIRVGNDTRTWQLGELIVFDDTIEHEAWNRSDQTRIVLIFDVWNPFLTAAERELVTAVTAAYAGFYPERLHKLD
jgi:aspartyl/asparaginyl beta-hydroxylase (cupin superfamily)